ncbi:MAG: sensor histidine kinase [Actinomycetota bacterium]
MRPQTRAEVERGQGRLLMAVFVLLTAFAGLSVGLSFLGDSFTRPLHLTPTSARIGVLLLTLAFIALVWERENELTRSARVMQKQELLLAAFENRLSVLESLLDAGDRLNAPLGVDDVLKVVLDAAIELVEAEGGSVDFFEDGDGDLGVAQTRATAPHGGAGAPIRPPVVLPLMVDSRMVGELKLHLPPEIYELEEVTRVALVRFSDQAARALDKARILAQERASLALLEATNEVKSRFLTTVSHELRTPLTSIIGYSATLENHWQRLEDAQRREFIHEIRNQGDRLDRVVERMLEAARVQLDGVSIEPGIHDLRTSIQKALAPFRTEDGSRIQVTLPRAAVHAVIDPTVFEQVVSNLVDNSLRYTSGSVRVALETYQSIVTITVDDDGPGMDANKLPLMLEPLQRIDENVHSGTGLGLHLVKTMVEALGGRGEIRTGSSGTTVTIMLLRSVDRRLLSKIPSNAGVTSLD